MIQSLTFIWYMVHNYVLITTNVKLMKFYPWTWRSGSSSLINSMDPVAHCIVLVTTHEYLCPEDIGDQEPVVCMVHALITTKFNM